MKKLLSVMALFVISVLFASLASAASSTESTLGSIADADVTVEVNDEVANQATLLVVEEGETLDIEVLLKNSGLVDAKGIEVLARLSGYEYSDYVELEDSTEVFDVKAGTHKKVNLALTVPEDLSNDEHTLRVFVLDRNSDVVISKEFKFTVESPRHSLQVEDVYFSPGSTVKAGRSLLTTVVVENYGDRAEKDVVVSVEVPELGLKTVEVLDEVAADERETADDLLLSLGPYTEAGEYDVVVSVKFDKYEEISETYTLTVVGNDAYNAESFPASDKLVLAVGPEAQSVAAGQTASYGVALTNAGKSAKAYAVEAVTGSWATTSVSESLVVLAPGESKVVYVDVTAAANAVAGDNTVSVTVKAGNDVVETVALKASVVAAPAVEAAADSFSLRNGLEIALIVLVVLLVVIGLIVGFSRLRKDDEDDQTYY